MTVHHLSRADARRLAVRAQLLTAGPLTAVPLPAERPPGVLDVVRSLTFLQHDPTAAVAPSAHLVLWSRLGSGYEPRELDDAVDAGRLVELNGLIRPAEDVALFTAEMAAWPGLPPVPAWREENRAWAEANRACRDDVLAALRGDGPLPASELPDTCVRPWRSSGWNDDKNVLMLLGIMAARGEVAVAGRDARGRLWDLAERVYPDDPPVPVEEARRRRDERRLRALGIARAKAAQTPNEPNHVGAAGEEAVVEGVRGSWRVDPALLDQPFAGRTALLSPLDRLVFDRKRMDELFEFDYALEMYKPALTRRWGYWALPVLHGDRLVGKLDAAADVAGGVLRVHAVHEDEPWDAATRAAVDAEIADLARWLELDLVRAP